MRLLAGTFVIALAYVTGLVVWGNPVWDTNDDVAMAMVAHGYGFAAQASPNVLFSNVIWGHIVQALHGVFGLQGYSIGALGSLVLSAWSCLYFLTRLGVTYWISLPVLATIFTWSTLAPQFTVNAGLLTIAGVLGVCTYAKTRAIVALISGCALATLGFLVRQMEFVLVLAIAAPFLPWSLLRERLFRFACLSTLLVMAAAYAVDRGAYSSSEWQRFSLENSARAPYTDFGITRELKRYPAILRDHGYSENDIDLIANWFFVDPSLFDVQALNGMVASLGPNAGPLSTSRMDLKAGLRVFEQLLTPRLLPLTIAAACLFLLFFRLTLAASWSLFFMALFGLGFVGANAHSRVIYPAMALLMVLPLISRAAIPGRRLRTTLASISMPVVAVYAAYLLQPVASTATARSVRAQEQMQSLGQKLLFVWGDTLNFEGTYPVKLSLEKIASSPPLFALGVMTHAPFSVAVHETKANRGFIERLRSPAGIPILTTDAQITLLKNYCSERLGGELRIAATDKNQKHSNLHALSCLDKGEPS